jgi:hypothetical protein
MEPPHDDANARSRGPGRVNQHLARLALFQKDTEINE